MFQILIVEDDKELSQLFQKVLEKNGYQVKSALDGAQALEVLDKEYIDPVSYTHLDVYKRQGLGLPGDLSSSSRFVRVAFTKVNAISGESEAVSYTHLYP